MYMQQHTGLFIVQTTDYIIQETWRHSNRPYCSRTNTKKLWPTENH